MTELTAELLLAAYATGYFPMARSRQDPEIHWYYPEQRGVIPLENFHIPRKFKKYLLTHPFELRTDTAFHEVINACAKRQETWINDPIISLYCTLHHLGFAHSVECWLEGELVGGLYGVALGAAFFGESMFSHKPNASKVALVHLVQLLRSGNYLLLDAQYSNPHLRQFGIAEIPRAEYLNCLHTALTHTPLPVF